MERGVDRVKSNVEAFLLNKERIDEMLNYYC